MTNLEKQLKEAVSEHKTIYGRIDNVDRKLDAAIFERKTEINALRAESKLNNKELSMEIKEMKKDIEKVSKDVCAVKGDIKDLKEYLIETLEKKTDNDEFLFWRNTIIIGLITSIFLMFVGILIK